MKKKLFFSTVIALLSLVSANAQIPDGYVKGSVTLADGSIVSGYVHDNIKKNAAVILVNDKGEDKKLYNSTEINAVSINGVSYQSVKGDFFKIICNGKMNFLQKASNASGKTIYNGAEVIVLSGTEGKIGDYFSYTNNELTLITKKTTEDFINQLSTCTAAVEKAKSVNGDIAAFADAVTIYNSYTK
jgi:hypothetical protein